MTRRSPEYLAGLVRELMKSPAETPWLEFKRNNEDPQEICEWEFPHKCKFTRTVGYRREK